MDLRHISESILHNARSLMPVPVHLAAFGPTALAPNVASASVALMWFGYLLFNASRQAIPSAESEIG